MVQLFSHPNLHLTVNNAVTNVASTWKVGGSTSSFGYDDVGGLVAGERQGKYDRVEACRRCLKSATTEPLAMDIQWLEPKIPGTTPATDKVTVVSTQFFLVQSRTSR